MYDLKTFGQMNLDMVFSGFQGIPDLGEEVIAQNFSMMLGGGPMTYPIVLDGLGCKVRLGTFLSENAESELCRKLMRQRGFDAYECFPTLEPNPVVVTAVLSEPKDRRFIAFNRGIHEDSLPSQTVYDFLSDARVVFVPVGHADVVRALSENGTKIVFDLGWAECRPIAEMKEYLKYISVFTPNDKEAMFITGAKSTMEALKILADYTENPVITRGSEGAIFYKNGIHAVAQLPQTVCVDTTGAGDNFLAGIIYGLCREKPLDECVKYGNIFAGISVTKYGCFGAPITLDGIQAGMAAYSDLMNGNLAPTST